MGTGVRTSAALAILFQLEGWSEMAEARDNVIGSGREVSSTCNEETGISTEYE